MSMDDLFSDAFTVAKVGRVRGGMSDQLRTFARGHCWWDTFSVPSNLIRVVVRFSPGRGVGIRICQKGWYVSLL